MIITLRHTLHLEIPLFPVHIVYTIHPHIDLQQAAHTSINKMAPPPVTIYVSLSVPQIPGGNRLTIGIGDKLDIPAESSTTHGPTPPVRAFILIRPITLSVIRTDIYSSSLKALEIPYEVCHMTYSDHEVRSYR